MYKNFYEEIKTLTSHDKKTKTQRVAKLAEETGELAQAILSETNAPGCEYKLEDKQDVLEECCDVLIVAASILAQYQFTTSRIEQVLKEKMCKWRTVCKDKKC